MTNKRINFFFIIFSIAFMPIYISAQSENDWISHISYAADITSLAQAGDKIYALTDGKLFIYDNSDKSLEEFIKYNGGNSDITHISYSAKQKCLFLTRADSNIELLFENKSYNEISDLKNYSSGQVTDKTINNVFIDEEFAYLSTNFGFVTVNISKREIKETGLFNFKFYSVSSYNDKLYAATERGIFFVDKNKNVQDFTNWEEFKVSDYYTDNDYKFKDTDIKDITLFKEKLHFLFPDSAVYIMESAESVKGMLKGAKPLIMYTSSSDYLMILSRDKFWKYTDLTTQNSFNINALTYIIPDESKQNEYWLSSSGSNLSQAKTSENGLEYLQQYITLQGPASNYPFSQTMANNQLLVAGGGFYYDRYGFPASISVWKGNKWSNIYPSQINQESGIHTRDFGYVISDPSNSDHIFASSWGDGLYEFENGNFKNRYDKTNTNNIIEEIKGENGWTTTRIGGMAYDKSGNLWMVNSGVKNIVKVYMKNGAWEQLYYPEIDGTTVNTNSKKVYIDRYSNKWIISYAGDNTNYLFVLNDNGTVSDTSDDKYKSIHNGDFTDQNGNKVDIWMIHDITEDNYGNIWLSTDIGPYWIANSSNITTKDRINLNRITIDKQTGSGSVTGLLENAAINSIAIDGAGRKWIATQTSGVFLLSTDNKEILEHFDLENSPLPSNNIVSLSIDPSGYVYFGSERGLMSYRAGATQGADDFSNVYVYPNPIRPDYSGIITVTGLKSDSHVKITDIKGNLIVEGKSLGGQFIWDGINAKGKRVDTGVYLVFGSTENGSEGVVTKIMVVK